MAYEKAFYKSLRNDRADAARARAFDAWYETLPEPEKAWCDRAFENLVASKWLGPQQAKALIVMAVLFVHMKVDEQDRWAAHGEFIRSECEWAELRAKKDEDVLA